MKILAALVVLVLVSGCSKPPLPLTQKVTLEGTKASLRLPADWAKAPEKVGKISSWEVASPDKTAEVRIVWSDKKDVPDQDLKRSAARALAQMKEGMAGGQLQPVQVHGLSAFQANLKGKKGEVLLTFVKGAQHMYLIFGSTTGADMPLIQAIEDSFQEGG